MTFKQLYKLVTSSLYLFIHSCFTSNTEVYSNLTNLVGSILFEISCCMFNRFLTLSTCFCQTPISSPDLSLDQESFWSANLFWDWNQGLTNLEFDTEDQVLSSLFSLKLVASNLYNLCSCSAIRDVVIKANTTPVM